MINCLINPVLSYFKTILKPLGLVFGDIGTSPIYTLAIVFSIIPINDQNVIGVVSLVIWTLFLLVCVQYSFLAMSLGKEGEGGTIVLREILMGLLKNERSKKIITFLTFIGIALLIGDNVLTPSISLLSAVEGMVLIPFLKNTPQFVLIGIACTIAVLLFTFQKHGTDKVSGTFGPIMIIWFICLALSGIYSIMHHPHILLAFFPGYAIHFLLTHGIQGFLILSVVFLCATGGEVLYADMGHIGKEPIIKAWYFVFGALVLNYLGQGAFLLVALNGKQVLYNLIYSICQNNYLYISFLILTIIATTIASQATISGMFSIVYQGINTRIMPLLKIDYTSPNLRSQIYIDSVNWFLLVFVLILIISFKESSKLGLAYGISVAGTMTLTSLMMLIIFYLKKSRIKLILTTFVLCVDLLFLFSNILKIPEGGFWSVLIAMLPLTLILIYNAGQKRLYISLKPTALDVFLRKYIDHYNTKAKISGTALFFARDIKRVPPYIVRTMLVNDIIYEDNIIISIDITTEPYGIESGFKQNIAEGFRLFEIKSGYMELINIAEILGKSDIDIKVMFYGIEDITTDDFRWNIFAFIKNNTPSFVKFYKVPSNKIQGVITQIEM